MDDIDGDLLDMMEKLHHVTHNVKRPISKLHVVTQRDTKVSPTALLVLTQALRKHPVFDLGVSFKERRSRWLTVVDEARSADADDRNDVVSTMTWINRCSHGLERERLRGVVLNPDDVMEVQRALVQRDTGMSQLPEPEANAPGTPVPWQLAYHQLFGSLLVLPPRCAVALNIHFQEETDSVSRLATTVAAEPYDTEAWVALIDEILDLPVTLVRQVWSAACFLYPHSGPLVTAYLSREIDALRQHEPLTENVGDDEARAMFTHLLRILNAFDRHLPLCHSPDLYRLFCVFAQKHVMPSAASLDAVFLVALRRDVGSLPNSTELWKDYLRWRGSRFLDAYERRNWTRKMYHKILQTPLDGLMQVRADYDNFVKSEFKGRPPPGDERLDMQYNRARFLGEELMQSMTRLLGGSFERRRSAIRPAGTPGVFLPRPCELQDLHCGLALRYPATDDEIEMWLLWSDIIDHEKNSSPPPGMEREWYARLRFFFSVRSSFFPHNTASWVEYILFCVDEQPLLSEVERNMMAKDVCEQARAILPHSMLLSVAYIDTLLRLTDASSSEIHATFQHIAMQEKDRVLEVLRKSDSELREKFWVIADDMQRGLENITVAAVNWMRWAEAPRETPREFHFPLVVRIVMQEVDFLSLTMTCVKRLVAVSPDFSPAKHFQPFNAFCKHWILLEEIRSRSAERAIGAFQCWADHLQALLATRSRRGWSSLDCGVDESFFAVARALAQGFPDAARSVLVVVDRVVGLITSDNRDEMRHDPGPLRLRDKLRSDLLQTDTEKNGETVRTTPFPISLDGETWSPHGTTPEDFSLAGAANLWWHAPANAPMQAFDMEPHMSSFGPSAAGSELIVLGTSLRNQSMKASVVMELPSSEPEGEVPENKRHIPPPDPSKWRSIRKSETDSFFKGLPRVAPATLMDRVDVPARSRRGLLRGVSFRTAVAVASTYVDKPCIMSLIHENRIASEESAAAERGIGLKRRRVETSEKRDISAISDLLSDYLPTLYEWEPAFKKKSISTDWLIEVLQSTAALN